MDDWINSKNRPNAVWLKFNWVLLNWCQNQYQITEFSDEKVNPQTGFTRPIPWLYWVGCWPLYTGTMGWTAGPFTRPDNLLFRPVFSRIWAVLQARFSGCLLLCRARMQLGLRLQAGPKHSPSCCPKPGPCIDRELGWTFTELSRTNSENQMIKGCKFLAWWPDLVKTILIQTITTIEEGWNELEQMECWSCSNW